MRKQLRAKYKIQRDKEKKKIKRTAQAERYSYENTFQYTHFLSSMKKCTVGVGWKTSVQNYYLNCIIKVYRDYLCMINKKLPSPISDRKIRIYERGKERTITPIHIKDRMIQKVLCDYYLTPILIPKLIYDNGASVKGKGVSFARKRMAKHLADAIKEYGTDFYVLSYDFKSFFDSIPHKTCRHILEKYIADKDIIKITMDIIKAPHLADIKKIKDKTEIGRRIEQLGKDELCGICLGSQVSQIMALVIANELDHYVKDYRKFRYYIRYMDDGKVFAKTKEELVQLFEEMKIICCKLGLKFNSKKTNIKHIKCGFTFLKTRYFVDSQSGKIIKKLSHAGIVRMRRKLRKLSVKYNDGTLSLNHVYDSMQSWLAHAKIADSYKTVGSMLRLYRKLFGKKFRMKKDLKINKGGGDNILQNDRFAKYRWGTV